MPLPNIAILFMDPKIRFFLLRLFLKHALRPIILVPLMLLGEICYILHGYIII